VNRSQGFVEPRALDTGVEVRCGVTTVAFQVLGKEVVIPVGGSDRQVGQHVAEDVQALHFHQSVQDRLQPGAKGGVRDVEWGVEVGQFLACPIAEVAVQRAVRERIPSRSPCGRVDGDSRPAPEQHLLRAVPGQECEARHGRMLGPIGGTFRIIWARRVAQIRRVSVARLLQVIGGGRRHPLGVGVHGLADAGRNVDGNTERGEPSVIFDLENLSLEVDEVDCDYLTMRLGVVEPTPTTSVPGAGLYKGAGALRTRGHRGLRIAPGQGVE